jgi:NRAMP (natural resistance-associated macrophage protein)-like metal ion transporter
VARATEPSAGRPGASRAGTATRPPGACRGGAGGSSGSRRRKPRNPRVASLARDKNPVRRFLRILGPGFITGASDDDPSGIGTYATIGAGLGYGMLWTALATFPLMATVQLICARIGLVTGRGLAGVLRRHYPRWLLYPVVLGLLVANTVNVGADLGAIAAAVNLLVPGLPIGLLVAPIALGILGLLALGSYRRIERTFRWLCLALVAYVGAALLARPDWAAVLRGTLLPSVGFYRMSVEMLIALLGTTISPYLFFWQASHEVEEQVAMGRRRLWQRQGATERELHYAALDVSSGMAFSNVVMYAIILATAATLHVAGRTDIGSAAQAAAALRPLAGDLSAALLAVGLIGTGILAVPILSASAAYALSEAFGWSFGLDRQPGRARQFYAVIALATLVGVGLNYLGINPIRALFLTAILNGVLAPPLLILILLVANNRSIMGARANGRLANVLGWTTALVMTLAAVALVAITIAR